MAIKIWGMEDLPHTVINKPSKVERKLLQVLQYCTVTEKCNEPRLTPQTPVRPLESGIPYLLQPQDCQGADYEPIRRPSIMDSYIEREACTNLFRYDLLLSPSSAATIHNLAH